MTYAQSLCKNQFFSNIFTFLSVILQYFEYNLKILANFHIKTQTSTDSAHTFTKKLQFWGDFLIKIILFTLTIYFFTTKDAQFFFLKISFLVTYLHFQA